MTTAATRESLPPPRGAGSGVNPVRRGSFRRDLLAVVRIQKSAAHRIVVLVDVALAEHDLEQVRARVRGPEHLSARNEIGTPHAPETLIEPPGVQRVDLVPVAVEA